MMLEKTSVFDGHNRLHQIRIETAGVGEEKSVLQSFFRDECAVAVSEDNGTYCEIGFSWRTDVYCEDEKQYTEQEK